MSYRNVDDEKFLEDLLRRKEFYSLKADPVRNFRDPPEGKHDPLTGKHLKIHSHQLFVRNFMNPNTPYKRLHLMHGCHARGTPILMFDGSVKNVEEINTGEQLMGDDGTPRTVLSLASGVETMYRVVPTKGEPFVCNESHILSLKCNDKQNVNYGKVVDISIRDYLQKYDRFKHTHKLYRVAVDFPEKPLEIDPYIMGFWLGDGSSYGPVITTQDAKIVQYFTRECPKFGACFSHKSQYDYAITTENWGSANGSNRFLTCLQDNGLLQNKHIPIVYKCNSRENRLKLLAGLLDSDGSYDKKGNGYDFIQKNERLLDDVVYLCRSLGFAAYKQPCVKKCTNSPNPDYEGQYYRIFISGDVDLIPVLLDRKKARPRQHNKDVLSVGFTLEKLPEDEYYGFELDGNRRYLLGSFVVTHNTGTGKTLAAISIAQEFIRVYKKMYASASAKMQAGRRNYAELDRTTPTVFVLGFGGTKAAFIGELLRHPEFGFISISEKEELVKRQKIAEAGLPDDIKHYKEYYSSLKKRITNKSRDGFYKFFGYDEFVNRLFLSDEVKLTDLEALATQKMRAGEAITLEDIIYEHIESGKIQVNQQLLQQFDESLIICDEIHNTYNMNMKNNRGVAIQFVLDSTPNVRCVTLSATPVNNSPTEVVELINYLVPTKEKITKKDLFINARTLQPGGYERIGKMTRGRISFLQDVNIKYFPKRIFEGEPIILPRDVENFKAGTAIPYLKFVKCPMSKFHQQTYNNHLEQVAKGDIQEDEGEIDLHQSKAPIETKDTVAPVEKESVERVLADEETETIERGIEDVVTEEDLNPTTTRYSYHSIPTDGYSIYDIAFPNPDSDEYGLFRSGEVRNKINLSSQEWKDKKKITVKKFSAINSLITGDFLTRSELEQYSTKYTAMIDRILEIIRSADSDPEKVQKIMIYHDRVKMSGVLLIQEILRMNNFLDEHSEPVDSTICCVCSKAMSEHAVGPIEPSTGHQFRPVRFVMAHSDVDKITMDQSLAKFNSPDNAHGLNFQILVGSKIIKESYNFKDIQHLLITSLPVNIPTLIQVFGRCVRKNSHINLSPEQRVVHICLFISTINETFPSADESMLSPEVYRYIDKLSDYIVIQNIEYETNRNALDADIHRDIIMPPDLYKQYFPNGPDNEPVSTIGNLYFDPAFNVEKFDLNELNLSTFTAYKYYEEEIRNISMIIKRLFMAQPVWTYDDLWDKVRQPPFGVEQNPKLFSENNYVIALNNLVSNATDIVSLTKQRPELTEMFLVEKIFDYNERYIYVSGARHKIEQVGKFYILFPVTGIPSNPLNVVYTEYLEHIRDKDRALIREMGNSNEKVMVDVESYLRPIVKKPGVRINIDAFVKESKADVNYIAKKNKFKEDYKNVETIEQMYGFLSEYNAQFQMSLLEESITYKVLGADGFPEKSRPDDNMGKLYSLVIDLFNRFGIVIYLSEVRKYKDTAKQYKFGIPSLTDDTPLGYILSKSIRLFDPQIEGLDKNSAIEPGALDEGRWFEISKIAMNKHLAYKENEVIIGYFETAEDHTKFKLRKPSHLIKADIAKEVAARKISKSEIEGATARTTVGDTRLIERGIVCITKTKEELLKIIASLGISISKLDRTDIRIKRLCEIIKTRLIESEIKERQKDSKWKYLYGWWDEQPQLG